jgi:1,4-alpha-glucan branching enzyme
MGDEIAQDNEWNHNVSLDWHLLGNNTNGNLNKWVQDLNHLYIREPALHEQDFENSGFEWINPDDAENSVISFLRRGESSESLLVVVCNFTPVPRYNYKTGVPEGGYWKEVLNSDAKEYGGNGYGNTGGVEAAPAAFQGKYDHTLSITLPPLGVLVFKRK